MHVHYERSLGPCHSPQVNPTNTCDSSLSFMDLVLLYLLYYIDLYVWI